MRIAVNIAIILFSSIFEHYVRFFVQIRILFPVVASLQTKTIPRFPSSVPMIFRGPQNFLFGHHHHPWPDGIQFSSLFVSLSLSRNTVSSFKVLLWSSLYLIFFSDDEWQQPWKWRTEQATRCIQLSDFHRRMELQGENLSAIRLWTKGGLNTKLLKWNEAYDFFMLGNQILFL